MSRKERPILFSAPMVRALLDGSKTQTRRVFKVKNGSLWPNPNDLPGMRQILRNCPYGQPGDRLWVREAWRIGSWNEDLGLWALDYCDGPLKKFVGDPTDWDGEKFAALWMQCCDELTKKGIEIGDDDRYHWEPGESPLRWRPSIHMPRWASRITLEITGVRVERVQDIDIADASAEGVTDTGSLILDKAGNEQGGPIAEYAVLWESINGPGSWEQNPWVWVIEFKRVVTA